MFYNLGRNKEVATQRSKIESHVECGEQGAVVQDPKKVWVDKR